MDEIVCVCFFNVFNIACTFLIRFRKKGETYKRKRGERKWVAIWFCNICQKIEVEDNLFHEIFIWIAFVICTIVELVRWLYHRKMVCLISSKCATCPMFVWSLCALHFDSMQFNSIQFAIRLKFTPLQVSGKKMMRSINLLNLIIFA